MIRSITLASLLLSVTLCGCARTVVSDPLITTYPVDDSSSELAYWHSLPSRSAVSNDEGLHGLILLSDTEDTTGSYEARVALAKQRRWLGEGFEEEANLAMQRGTLARAVAVICNVRGGVMMQLVGPTPRYATRELVAMGMIPEGSSENQSITGLEYMSVITQAQDYLNSRTQGAPTPTNPVGPYSTTPNDPAPQTAPSPNAPTGRPDRGNLEPAPRTDPAGTSLPLMRPVPFTPPNPPSTEPTTSPSP